MPPMIFNTPTMSDTSLIQKLREFVVSNFHKLIQIHDTPHSIAGGVSIGIFVGFTPLFIPFVPLKSSLSFLVSWLFRCSKTAAVIAVTAHDVIFPIWPLVLRWEYQIGYWLLHHQLPPHLNLQIHKKNLFEHWFSTDTNHSWLEWVQDRMNWAFVEKVLAPTILGSVFIGIPCAVVCYIITLRIVNKYQGRLIMMRQSAPETAPPDEKP